MILFEVQLAEFFPQDFRMRKNVLCVLILAFLSNIETIINLQHQSTSKSHTKRRPKYHRCKRAYAEKNYDSDACSWALDIEHVRYQL